MHHCLRLLFACKDDDWTVDGPVSLNLRHSPQRGLRALRVGALHRRQRIPVKHYGHRLVLYT